MKLNKSIALSLFCFIFLNNVCDAQMHGTYTIGKNGTENFSSFAKAIYAVVSQGTSNSVIFKVSAGIYDEQLFLPVIFGSESYAPVYFQSADSNANSVIIKYKPTSDTMNYTIEFFETNHVYFQWLTFSTDTISGRIVQIDRYCNELRFENCIFKGMKGGAELVYSPSMEGDCNNYLMFTNNHFIDGSVALSLTGESATPDKNTYLKNNTFSNQSKSSILLKYHTAPTILSNFFVNNTNNQGITGIRLDNCSGATNISRNIISLPKVGINSFGIRLWKSSGTLGNEMLIANNFIFANTIDFFAGIDLTNSNYINILFNSIQLKGNATGSTAINFILGSYTILRNNILANNAKGFALISSSNSNLVSDHNNLYTTGDVLINHDSKPYLDLNEWKTFIAQETGSLSVFPEFCGDSNLHTFNPLLNNKGISIGIIKTDFDGESRGTTPDIGADEFAPISLTLGKDLETCIGQDLKVTAPNGFENYLWSNGNITKELIIKSTINKDSLSDVWVKTGKKGCFFYDTIKVSFHSFPVFSLGNDTTICWKNFDSMPIFGPIGYKSYRWQDASDTSFYMVKKPSSFSKKLYWLKITNDFNCSNTDSLWVDFVICEGLPSDYKNQTLKLFPNPAENSLYIEQNSQDFNHAEIYNSNGEMVIKTIINGSSDKVDIQNLKSGIYLIKLTDGESIKNGLFYKR